MPTQQMSLPPKTTQFKKISLIRWLIILLILSGSIVYLGWLVTLPIYFYMLALILGLPLLQFLFTPILRLFRFYKYLSPMVLSIVYSKKNIELHNGTSFDYFLNMKWSDRGSRAQKILWLNYFYAFLALIEKVETGKTPADAVIKGHSYFFNNRTAEKLGFTVSPADSKWKWNSIFNGIEIICLYSYSQGKWAIPKLAEVKTAATTGEKLVSKKELIQNLAARFEKDLTSN